MVDAKLLNAVVEDFKLKGLLLESDLHLPSVTTVVVGEAVRGSWWGHPRGMEIWHVLKEFLKRKDVLTTRLVSGKVTFIHRRFWSDLLAICTSREIWQTRSLSPDAKRLLHAVEREGAVRTDMRKFSPPLKGKVGDAARELERRLLVHSDEVHTERGAHAKVLRTWSRWSDAMNLKPKRIDASVAKEKFEDLVSSLNSRYGGDGRLPWVAEKAR